MCFTGSFWPLSLLVGEDGRGTVAVWAGGSDSCSLQCRNGLRGWEEAREGCAGAVQKVRCPRCSPVARYSGNVHTTCDQYYSWMRLMWKTTFRLVSNRIFGVIEADLWTMTFFKCQNCQLLNCSDQDWKHFLKSKKCGFSCLWGPGTKCCLVFM